jgi:hypothetical protein
VCDCWFVCRWLGGGIGAAGVKATREEVESKREGEAAAA